jgi:hypothetical protein
MLSKSVIGNLRSGKMGTSEVCQECGKTDCGYHNKHFEASMEAIKDLLELIKQERETWRLKRNYEIRRMLEKRYGKYRSMRRKRNENKSKRST